MDITIIHSFIPVFPLDILVLALLQEEAIPQRGWQLYKLVMLTFLPFCHYIYIISTHVCLGQVNTREKESSGRERC